MILTLGIIFALLAIFTYIAYHMEPMLKEEDFI